MAAGHSRRADLGDLRTTARKLVEVARARIALRACDQVGSLVRLRGRVLVTNRGTLRIGARVKLHGLPSPIELTAAEGGELVIGEGTSINRGVCVCARASVRIGRRCGLGNDVLILDSDFHRVGDLASVSDVPAPVTIGDGVWLAARAVVLKGVTVGEGAVVCAGAVVVTSVPPYTMVGGSPARPIGRVGDGRHAAG